MSKFILFDNLLIFTEQTISQLIIRDYYYIRSIVGVARNTQFLSTLFTTGAYTNTSDRSATV